MKSMNAFAPAGFFAPLRTPAYSTWRKQVSSRALVVGFDCALRDRERRRRRVGQHDRPVALAAAGGEVDLVGVGPAGGDLGAVGHQPRPVVLPAVAVLRDRGEQEREPGRGARRARRDEQVLVRGLRQVVQGARRGRPCAAEPGVVDVHAHVAVVDRGELLGVGGVRERVRRGRGRQVLGGVVGEHALVDGARGERVVDAVGHVGDRGALGEHQLVGELAGVAVRLDLDAVPGLRGELLRAPASTSPTSRAWRRRRSCRRCRRCPASYPRRSRPWCPAPGQERRRKGARWWSSARNACMFRLPFVLGGDRRAVETRLPSSVLAESGSRVCGWSALSAPLAALPCRSPEGYSGRAGG